MAMYYVSKSGSNTAPYDTWAKAATTIQAAITAAGSGPDTIEIDGGPTGETYAERLTSGGANITLKGSLEVGRSGQVTIGTSGGHIINIAHTGWVFQHLSVTNAQASSYNLNLGFPTTWENCDIYGGDRAVTTSNITGTHTFTRCHFRDTTSTSYSIYLNLGAAGQAVFNYCQFFNAASNAVTVNTGLAIDFNNCLFAGARASVIACLSSFSGAVRVRNSVGVANGLIDGSYYIMRNLSSAGGTLTVSNSMILPNALNPDARLFENVIDGGGNIYKSPQFMSPRRPGYVCIIIDDYDDDFFSAVAALVKQYGGSGATFAVCGSPTYPLDHSYWNDKWAGRAANVALGHEIASHSMTHVDLVLASTAVLEYEVETSKATIESKIQAASGQPYECKSFVHPYNSDNATTQAAVQAAGYLGARGVSTQFLMENIFVYDLPSYGPETLIGTDNIERNATALGEWLTWVGGVITLYLHSATEYSLVNLEMLISGLSKTHVQMVTMGTAIDLIRTGVDADADGTRWTQTFTDTSDLSLQSSSPCIRAGADLGLTEDFVGTAVPQRGTPDIGAYEFVRAVPAATAARWQAMLRALKYKNTTASPTAGVRSLTTHLVTHLNHKSPDVTKTITIPE